MKDKGGGGKRFKFTLLRGKFLVGGREEATKKEVQDQGEWENQIMYP